jgi:hypothetical protein
MKYLAVLLLISWSAILTVGFMTMPKQGHHTDSNCIVSVLDKAACSSQNQNMAVHHIEAYNSFTNILLSILSLLVLAAIFVAVLSFELFKPELVPIPVFENTFTPQGTHLRRWLSRFINSPTFN